MKKKKLAAAVTLLAFAVPTAGVAWIGPSNVIGMLRYDQREEGRLKVGDPAPDVELLAVDGERRERLSAHIGEKPLVLILGSFT